MPNNLQSLRQTAWGDGPANAKDVGENFRDVADALDRITRITPVSVTLYYSPPHAIRSQNIPAAVSVAACKRTGGFPVCGVTCAWTSNNVGQVSITGIYGIDVSGLYAAELTKGDQYDLVFLLIG